MHRFLSLLFACGAVVCVAQDAFLDSCIKKSEKPILPVAAPISDNTKRVGAIFENNCIGCHSEGSVSTKKFDDILNVQQLKDKGIVSTEAEKSPLYLSVTRDKKRMPLGEDPLSQEDVGAIVAWMKEGSPAFAEDQGTEQAPKPYVSYENEVACISYDVSRLTYYDAQYVRYLTLATIYNMGDPLRLKKAQWAVHKLLNSISFNPHLTKAAAVDGYGVIWRLDLRDYDLEAHDWDVVLLKLYPYAIDFFEDEEFDGYEVNIQQKTRSPQAFLRGDWFVNTVSQPPIYERFLGLPGTLQELDALLRLDKFRDYYHQDLARAAIRHSGVAHYNRVVDRRDLRFWSQGQKIDSYYWITYDVADLADKLKNFFAFPFGPRELNHLYVGKTDAWYLENKLFKHDAGEVIFGLPNGLQAFYLANNKGVQQVEVPLTIAADRKNKAPQIGTTPFAIVNGVSCMGCHSAGVNPYADQLRNHVLNTAGFTKKQVDDLLYILPEQENLNRALNGYNDTFRLAMGKIVDDETALDPSHEPVFHTSKYYEDYLTIRQLGFEVGLPEKEIKACLFHSPDLSRILSLTDPEHDIVSRDVVEQHFHTILKECNVGKQLVFKAKQLAYEQPYCKVVVANYSGYSVLFKVGGSNYQLYPSQSYSWDLGYGGHLALHSVYSWNGYQWMTSRDAWNLACRNYSFRWESGRARLYQ
jgi:mono/diheme cytochrome c family protein